MTSESVSTKQKIAEINALVQQGAREEALQRVLLLSQAYPATPSVQYFCGVTCYNLEEYTQAIPYLCKTLRLWPRHKQARELLLYAFYLSKAKEVHDDVIAAFCLILKNPQGQNVTLIERCWTTIVRSHPVLGEMVNTKSLLGYDAFKVWADAENDEIFLNLGNDLFTHGLQLHVIPDVVIERFVQNLRYYILEQIVHHTSVFKTHKKAIENIALSLAQGCFNNDYLFDVSIQEKYLIAKLREDLEQKNRVFDISAIAVLASYEGLGRSEILAKRLKGFPFAILNPRLKSLVSQQIKEPEQEKKLAQGLPALGRIENAVSKEVQSQYEENPYPRWSYPKPLHSDEMAEILNLYAKRYTKVLVAGSATGEYSMNIALSNPQIDVTGVDLSLSSLGYAKRKATAFKVKNLKLKQGDILEVGHIDEEFDVIESVGVLHHMEDPEAGLKALVGVLKKGGHIKLGLYSTMARRHITECQNKIKEMGLKPVVEDIRKARQYVEAMPDGHDYRKMLEYNDFYNVSMVRDMLFHVKEHCFSIPQMEALLKAHNLRFIGFSDIDTGEAKLLYGQKFPEDKEMTNLKNWDTFEKEFPDTFIRMYKFWCVKQ